MKFGGGIVVKGLLWSASFVLFAGVLGARAGSLTPSAVPGATMHTLGEIFDALAGTYDATAQTASANGNISQQLKYIATLGLQNIYTNSSTAAITTASGKDLTFSLADTATDSKVIVDILGTGNTFEVRDSGTAIFTVADGGISTFASSTGSFVITPSASYTTLLPATGDYLLVGDAGTTSHSLAANDDLLVSGKLEVDGAAYFDSTLTQSGGQVSFTPTQTIASGASATWDGFTIPATTATITGATAITTATGFNLMNISQPTLSSAANVTNSASFYIANAPTISGGGAITNAYALWVDGGTTRFDGDVTIGSAGVSTVTIAHTGETPNPVMYVQGTGTSDTTASLIAQNSDGTVQFGVLDGNVVSYIAPATAPANGRYFDINTVGNAGGTVQGIFFNSKVATTSPTTFYGTAVFADVGDNPGEVIGGGTVRGVNIRARHRGTQAVTSLYGGYVAAETRDAGSTTTQYGWYIDSMQLSTGTIGTNYGLYIGSVSAGTTNTYAFYSAPTAQSYFGGNLGLGTTSPTALLDVNNTTTTTITAGANARMLNVQGALTEAASGVHARIAGVEITPPTITAGVATVTDTASLYISAAPTATVTGANYALWVDSGAARFDGDVTLAGTTTFDGAQTIDATNAEALLVRIDADGGDVFTVNTTTPSVTIGSTVGSLNITAAADYSTLLPATGDYTRIGDAGTTAHALAANDDLMVSGILEVSGNAFLDGTTTSTLGAAEKLYVDATTTTHTDTAGAIDVDVTAGAASVRGIYAATNGGGDNNLVAGIRSDITSAGITTAGKAQMAMQSVINNSATDAASTVLIGNGVFTGVMAAGAGTLYGTYTGFATAAGAADVTTTGSVVGSYTNIKATGEAVTVRGLDVTLTKSTNTATDLIGAKFTLDPGASGALTNFYGIQLSHSANQTATGTALYIDGTNEWGTAINSTGKASFTPSQTIASGASATWDGFTIPAATATISGSTNIDTATGFNLINISQPTLSAGTALTVANSASLYIANAPTAAGAGPAAITNAYALWVDSGAARFDGDVTGTTIGTTGAVTTTLDNITTTSTDALVLQNTTDSTVGVTTQQAPRLRFHGESWDTDGSNDTWDLKEEFVPATGATTTSDFYWATSKNGAAYSTFMTFGGIGGAFPKLTISGGLQTSTTINNTGVGDAFQASGVASTLYFSAATGTNLVRTGPTAGVAGVARELQFDIPITTGGAAAAVVGYRWQLDTTDIFTVLGQTDGAGSYQIPVTAVAKGQFSVTPTQTIASAAGAVYDGFTIPATTMTASGSTDITTATGFNLANIAIPNIASAANVTNSATWYIAGAPTISGGGAITNAYSLWVDAGNARMDGNLIAAGMTMTDDTGYSTILPTTGEYLRVGDAGTTSQTLNTNDDLFVSGKLEVDGAAYFDGALAFATDADFTLAGNENVTIGNTTNTLGAAGLLDLAATTATADTRTLNIVSTNTTTTGNTAYSLYNALNSSAVVTGTAQNLYGSYNAVTKTGLDTSVATTTLYGVYGSASNTGSTDAGTKDTYAGYFTATGDTNGTATAYGIYAAASGADTNYAASLNGLVLISGRTTLGDDATTFSILPATGDYTRIGDAGTTAHALAANDDLLVSGILETSGASYFDGTATYTFGAAEKILVDATATAHTDTTGAIDLDLTAGAANVRGIYVVTAGGGDYNLVSGIRSDLTSGGITTAGKAQVANLAVISDNAADATSTAVIGNGVVTGTMAAGAGILYGNYVGFATAAAGVDATTTGSVVGSYTNIKATGEAVNVRGIDVALAKSTNTATDFIGAKFTLDPGASGALTNFYGLQLSHSANQTATGTALYIDGTNEWGTAVSSTGKTSFTPSQTIASGASATWDGFTIPAATATITGSTNIDTATGFNLINISQPTLSAGTALTVANSASLYIANAPTAAGAGPAAITNAYALWVDSGAARFDGAVTGTTIGTTGAVTTTIAGIAATPTDGLVLQNTTDSTSGVTVQMSPRTRYHGEAWNTASNDTFDFVTEVLPVTAATTTASLRWGYSKNGEAYTYPMTLSNSGTLGTTGTGSYVGFSGAVSSPNAGYPFRSTVSSNSANKTAGGYITYYNYTASNTSTLGTGYVYGDVIASYTSKGSSSGSITVVNHVGYFDGFEPAVNSTVTNRIGFAYYDAVGAGAITNQYGLYIPALTKGATSDYGIYFAGAVDTGSIGSAAGVNISIASQGAITPTSTQTIASADGAVLDAINFDGTTTTISGSTNITTATGFNYINIDQPTYSNASIAITNGATMYIANAPTVSGGGSITNAYSLWVDAGAARFDGAVIMGGLASGTGGGTYDAICLNTADNALTVNTNGDDCVVSSRRFKENIANLDLGLAFINSLTPRQFNYIGENDPRVGFIAEEVALVDPRLAFFEKDGVTARGVRYQDMTAALTKAVQELDIKIAGLQPTSSSQQSGAASSTSDVSPYAGYWSLDAKGNLVSSKAIGVAVSTSQGEKTLLALVGPRAQVILSGSAQLNGGQATVYFNETDPTFAEVISASEPFKVLLTPTASTQGLYTGEKLKELMGGVERYVGFRVHEQNNGSSNGTFDWVVVAVRDGYEGAAAAATSSATTQQTTASSAMDAPATTATDTSSATATDTATAGTTTDATTAPPADTTSTAADTATTSTDTTPPADTTTTTTDTTPAPADTAATATPTDTTVPPTDTTVPADTTTTATTDTTTTVDTTTTDATTTDTSTTASADTTTAPPADTTADSTPPADTTAPAGETAPPAGA